MTLPSRMFRDPLQVLIDKENAIENRLKGCKDAVIYHGTRAAEDYRQLRSRVESGAQGPLSGNSREQQS